VQVRRHWLPRRLTQGVALQHDLIERPRGYSDWLTLPRRGAWRCKKCHAARLHLHRRLRLRLHEFLWSLRDNP